MDPPAPPDEEALTERLLIESPVPVMVVTETAPGRLEATRLNVPLVDAFGPGVDPLELPAEGRGPSLRAVVTDCMGPRPPPERALDYAVQGSQGQVSVRPLGPDPEGRPRLLVWIVPRSTGVALGPSVLDLSDLGIFALDPRRLSLLGDAGFAELLEVRDAPLEHSLADDLRRVHEADRGAAEALVRRLLSGRVVQKRIAEEMAARDRALAALARSVPGALYQCSYDASWRTLLLSEHFEAISGYPVSDFLQNQVRSFRDLVVPEDLAKIRSAVKESIRAGRPYEVEYRIRNAHGEIRWLHDRGSAEREPGSERAIRLSGVMLDVTVQRAERDRRELLEVVAENARDCVLVTEAEPVEAPGPRIVYANRAFFELTGYAPEEVIGRNPRMLQGACSERGTLNRIKEALIQKAPVEVEILNYRKDGTPFWAELSISPVFDGQGRCTHFVSVQRDVSARRNHQSLLRLFGSAVERANDCVIVTDLAVDDPGPRILYVNDAFTRMTGYTRQEAIGQTPRMLQGPDSDRATLDRIRAALEARQPVEVEVLNYRSDGTPFWAEVSIKPLVDENGVATHFLSVQRDVTARRESDLAQERHAEELRCARDAAERAADAKSAFLATMSHEIRTPMNGVVGMTSLLLDTPLDREQRELVETIRFSGDALLGIINDILDFSKVEAGQVELEEQAFELDLVVEEAVELCAPRARERGLRIGASLAADVPVWVRGDLTRLRQILVNLIGNAVKFTEAGEVSVEVRLSPEADKLSFSVRDTGIGIPSDRKERLFQAFSQVDASINRRFGGTGLGLAITKQLVELMGGSISVESEAGKGSTFHFDLDLEPLPPAVSAWEARARSLMSSCRAAVITRWPIADAFLRRALTRAGVALIEPAALRAGDLVLVDAEVEDERPPAGRKITFAIESSPVASLPQCSLLLRMPLRAERFVASLLEVLGHPREDAEAGQSRPPILRPLDRPLRVLVAEDNVVNQRVIQKMLRRLGIEPDLVANGQEALDLMVAGARYDVVLMDLQMPVMDGLTAARAIRRCVPTGRQPRILALTANAMAEDRDRCRAAGMDGFLPKPIRPERLRAALAGELDLQGG